MGEAGEPEVGARLRDLRRGRGLSLRTLAERCSLSPNTISLIERGESSPSVSTLHRLATALGVQITAFFDPGAGPVQVVLTRANDRRRSSNALVILESLGAGLASPSVEPFMVTLQPGADSGPQPIVHTGQEMVHCLSGEVEYEVAGRTYRLAVGDTLLFEARLPHRWRSGGDGSATFLLVFGDSSGTRPAEKHLRT